MYVCMNACMQACMVMEIRIQRPCKAIAKLFPCLYEPQGISIDIRVLGRAEECERYRRFGLLLGLATCREISEHKSGDSEGVHILVCYAVSTGKYLPMFGRDGVFYFRSQEESYQSPWHDITEELAL